ncbi:MAG: hypothetical protein EAX95_10855 [Candidatus Thorarchaeota archaeon]|nr:hypothetical protein [Candidatus Thorarchaeota archaeon]
MVKSYLKIGSIIMMAMGVFALVVSLLWIFITEIMFVSDFLFYTGQSFADYLAANPAYAEMYIITKKLLGVAMTIVSLLMIIVTKVGYEKGEKWSWWALLLSGGMLWGMLIGYRVFIGYTGGSMITFVVGAILYLLAIILPAKEILSKEQV